MRRAVFLDRDGVLIEDRSEWATAKVEDLRILPGVADACDLLRRAGYALIMVTNQGGISRGFSSLRRQSAVCAHVSALCGSLDGTHICPHGPDDGCLCRKPLPGMLQLAAMAHRIDLAQSWMIGDRHSDMVAGHRAGCRTILVNAAEGEEATDADCVVERIQQAANVILGVDNAGTPGV